MQKDKGTLKRSYRKVCLEYLYQLFIDWNLYEGDEDGTQNFGWWVGDEVGSIYCLEDDTFIDMDDIRYCVDNNVSRDTYEEYTEYNLNCSEYGFDTMNLDAFVHGAPRIPKESFDRLSECKKTLYDAIEDIKEKRAKL
jgi:hypothetical protein